MKQKMVLMTILSLIVNPIIAKQTDYPSKEYMFSENTSWTYQLGYVYQIGEDGMGQITDNLNKTDVEYYWSLSDNDCLYVKGTKEKNGKTYSILKFKRLRFQSVGGLMYFNEGADFPTTPSKTFEIGIREEGGKVYVDREEYLSLLSDGSYWLWVGKPDYLPYEQTSDGELVLYDFTMNVGDKYPSVSGHEDITVVATDKMNTLDGAEHRVLLLSNGLRIIEGIGCVNSNGFFLFYLNSAAIKQAVEDLAWFSKRTSISGGDITLYSQPKVGNLTWLPWYPTTTTRIPSCTVNKPNGPVYDLSGRRVDSSLSRGIYIQNGKKIIK